MTLSTSIADDTATTHESVADKQGAFSDSLTEPEYGAVRRELGLRPDSYSDDGPDNHPDRRPCPSWCWIGQSRGKYDHEVNPRHPMTALHTIEGYPHVVASLYEGATHRGDGRWIQAATIEPHLEQLGQGAPVIRVNLRRWKGREQKYGEILRLTLTDAQEFAAALDYLVKVAEA